MDNPRFIDEEDIQLIHQDDEDYNTPNTSRIYKTSFTVPDATEATSTLRLRQKVKRDKINSFYRHVNVTANLDFIDQDQFRLTIDPKKGVTIFEFYNGDWCVPLTKQTGEFFAPKALRNRLGGLNKMKNFLDIDKTPPDWKNLLRLQLNLSVNCQQTQGWKVYRWKSFHPWLMVFMLRRGKHRKIMTLTCVNFQESIRPYKAYMVNS